MKASRNLDLETSRVSLTSGSLELSTLRQDSWGFVLVWAETEVSDSLSGVSWTSDKQSVLTQWGAGSQLVQSDSLTTSLDNLSTGTSSKSQSSNGGLWELEDTVIIGDGTDNNNGLLSSTFLGQGTGDSRNRDWWSVDLRKEQRFENNLVEWSISTTWQ
jgi:hypothetical protein